MIHFDNIRPVAPHYSAELSTYWTALVGEDMTGPLKAMIKLAMDEAGVPQIKWGWSTGSKSSLALLVRGQAETIKCTKKYFGETDEKRARRIAEVAVAVLRS